MNPHTAGLAASALSLTLVGVLALMHVPYPFGTDQGLFTHFAEAMSRGARLYVDMWEPKQPALYAFYFAGGILFGFDEIGIHTLEWSWMLALAVLLVALTLRRIAPPWLAAFAPLAALGPYYAAADSLHLTQAEILVAVPLAAVAWLLVRSQQGERWPRFLAGAALVAVAAFKFALVGVPLAMLAARFLQATWIQRLGLRAAVVELALPALLGASVALLALILALSAADILGAALWTAFAYPARAIVEVELPPYWRMRDSIEWFVGATWPLLALAAIGGVREVLLRRTVLGWQMAGWLAGGVVVVLAQRLSWWQYHFNLFFVPIGVLALCGISAIWERVREARTQFPIPASAVAGVILLLALTPTVLVPMASKVHGHWLSGPWPFSDTAAFMDRVDRQMPRLRSSVEFLAREDSLPGSIAVFGDGRIYRLAGRPAFLLANGQAYLLREQTRRVAHALQRERPAYVYTYPPSIRAYGNGDEILALIKRDYVEHSRDARDGIWYERKRQ